VAGLRHAGSKVGFSDLGPQISISAPAGNCINIGAGEPCLYPILSSSNSGTQRPNAGGSIWTDSYDFSVGTSFAAPIVTGTAALMLSAQPQLLPDELRRLMQASARSFPTSGAGNDEYGQPVPVCRAPDGTDQLQCYCSTALCGAGMLDAAAAVSAAGGTLARLSSEPAVPVVGDTVSLSAAPSLPGSGRSVVAYAWSLVGNPDSAASFSGAVDAAQATFQATRVGKVTVNLLITDDAGHQSSVQRSIEIAAPMPPAPDLEALSDASADAGGGGGGGGGSGGGSGGGASSALWVALLCLAIAALLHTRRHRQILAGSPLQR